MRYSASEDQEFKDDIAKILPRATPDYVDEVFKVLVDIDITSLDDLNLVSVDDLEKRGIKLGSAKKLKAAANPTTVDKSGPVTVTPTIRVESDDTFVLNFASFGNPEELASETRLDTNIYKHVVHEAVRQDLLVDTDTEEQRLQKLEDRLAHLDIPIHPVIIALGPHEVNAAKYVLTIEGIPVTETTSVGTALSLVFAAHYVFRLNYHPDASELFELIQRDVFVTPREWCRCFDRTERPCTAYKRRISSDMFGVYVPECDIEGYYRATQCHASIGICWCVDKHGVEFANTRSRGKPDCGEYINIWHMQTALCILRDASAQNKKG
ncbi:hypothetical protein B566_EDAN003922 [Ephemera danica]|nr:hypothetical protein B566_EDAN003922 [Ephemera danica]